MKKLALVLTLACTLSSLAQDNPLVRLGNHVVNPWTSEGGEFYKSQELTLDLAGTYTVQQPNGFGNLFNQNTLRDGTWGMNVGSTYWASRYVGVGLGAGVIDLNNPGDLIFDYSEMNLSLRLPIGRFAPYGTLGGGRNFADGLYSTHCAAGLEFRATPRAGFFGEARYAWQAKEEDLLSFRAGIRWTF